MAPLENDISEARDNNLDTAASAKGEMKTSPPPTDVSRMKTVPPTKLAPTATTSSATSQVKTTPPAAENKKEKVEKTHRVYKGAAGCDEGSRRVHRRRHRKKSIKELEE